MIPTTLITLPQLPLTTNGKIDQRALPKPEFGSTASTRPPSSPEERILCDLFAHVLDIPAVGPEDNFFELGGHSLLATRLIAEARPALGVDLHVRTLFQAPTPAALAQTLDVAPARQALEVLLPLRPRGGRPPLFCVHPGEGISWPYAGLLHHLDPDQPLYGIQARGLDGQEQLPGSVGEMAADYLKQIRAVQPSGPYHLLGWSFGGVVAHAIATLLQQAGEQVPLLALLDAHPRGGGVELPPLTERDIRALFLDVAGDGAAAVPADLLEEGTLSALTRVCNNNIRLQREFTPGRFRGDLLLFAAARTPAGIPADRRLTPRSWRPYVEGGIDTHVIDCTHHHLTRPEALARIGPVLAAALEATAGRHKGAEE